MAIDFDRLRELMQFLSRSNLDELEVEEGGHRIRLVRTRQRSDELRNSAAGEVSPPVVETAAETQRATIRASTFGTIYRAGAPNSPPLVDVGDQVSVGQAVAMIEAMKTFITLTSDASGTIASILFKDGDLVEEGQTLFTLI